MIDLSSGGMKRGLDNISGELIRGEDQRMKRHGTMCGDDRLFLSSTDHS